MDFQIGDRVSHPDFPSTEFFYVIDPRIPGYLAHIVRLRAWTVACPLEEYDAGDIAVYADKLQMIRRVKPKKSGFAKWISSGDIA